MIMQPSRREDWLTGEGLSVAVSGPEEGVNASGGVAVLSISLSSAYCVEGLEAGS
jgi:hypothetical protein